MAETDKIYTIGIVPQFETKKLRRIWKPILKQLEQRTGLQFKIRGAATIPAFEKEFLAGRFDFAYMNPFHLLIGYETQGYIPLVRDHGKKLHGVLVVRKDSVIKSIKDLDSKTVAFPSPNALAASLQMRAEMHDIFNINIHPSYVKTHDSVYLNVLLKRATAGGGVQKTFNRQSDKIKNNLKIIHTTTPVAPHPLAAHPRVGKEVYNKVKQAFIDLAATDTGKKLLAKIPMKKAGPATIKDYRPLAEMKLKRFYQEN
ncbi:MAG: phosphate/phosphite/phosphonate ABC transporter substrate-binding protein [Gammaproteobacteria bacterium]|nr:phosphate/phosphite/phosphonate ABC transporter substrate-binding protein [Gammaproteobacteria bacterium]